MAGYFKISFSRIERNIAQVVYLFRRAALAALIGFLSIGFPTWAQTPQKPTPPTAPSSPVVAPNASSAQNLFDEVGRWFHKSITNWNENFKGAADVAKSAADKATNVTRETAGAVARLPSARVVAGREKCIIAPNGAPDCQSAATALCKANGFASGKSVDFETLENCPPITLARRDGDTPPRCTIENFVVRAFCQ